MKNKSNKKNNFFEFLTLLTTIIGIVIGTGEFIKNDNQSPGHVLYATNGNAILAMIVWIVIGIACIFMMLTFMEIASSTSKKGNGTTSGWLKIFANRRLASFVSLFWVFLYVPIFYTFFSIATTEYILVSFNIHAVYSIKYIMMYFFIGLFVMTFFTMINTFSHKFGKYLQIVGTGIKAIPFILILILGFIPAINHSNGNNAFSSDQNHIWKASSFFLATGPVLFSFDGFIFACNLQKETKNKKLISPALLVGIIIVVVIYLLEALALFLGTKDGSVFTLFENSFHSKSLSTSFGLLIVFAILIGLNGNSIVGSRYIQSDSQSGLIYSKNKISLKKSSLIQAGIGLIWFIILISFGLFYRHGNHDGKFEPYHFSDLMSNGVVVLAFLIYISLMICAIVNRFTKKVEVKKVKGMPVYAAISSSILIISISYSIYLILKSQDIVKYLIIICLLINTILFVINEFLLKKYNGNNPEEQSFNDEKSADKSIKNESINPDNYHNKDL